MPRQRKNAVTRSNKKALSSLQSQDEMHEHLFPSVAYAASPEHISSGGIKANELVGVVYSVSNTYAQGLYTSLSMPAIPATCSLLLSQGDHAAINHFRTTFATNQHTKNPQYSMISVIFQLAQRSAMLMHMAIAIAGRDSTFYRMGERETGGEFDNAICHYNAALRAMSETFRCNAVAPNLDVLLATLWLMVVYEQRFGDGSGNGLTQHLRGAASILRQHCSIMLRDGLVGQEKSTNTQNEESPDEHGREKRILPIFVARMIVWLSAIDAGAAAYGNGGCINSFVIHDVETWPNSPLRGLVNMHQFSRPLYRTVWGNSYPMQERLDDIQNHDVYDLLSDCVQIRFMIAQLAKFCNDNFMYTEETRRNIESALSLVKERYAEIFDLATMLKFDHTMSQRLLSNILHIVPYYHSVILELYRAGDSRPKALDKRQHGALRAVMVVAHRAYNREGDIAMLRIAWPLFIAAISTDDVVHREWLLLRFQELGRFGINYVRAYKVLRAVIEEQEKSETFVDVIRLLGSGEYAKFVI